MQWAMNGIQVKSDKTQSRTSDALIGVQIW